VEASLIPKREIRRTFLGCSSMLDVNDSFWRSKVAAIRNLLAAGIILDIVFRLILYRSVHPGAALGVGPTLICIPLCGEQTANDPARGMGKR
jgi:hypothetical protein